MKIEIWKKKTMVVYRVLGKNKVVYFGSLIEFKRNFEFIH